MAIYSRGQRKVYAFDRAFDGACSQEHVYQDTKSLIRSVLDGVVASPTSGDQSGKVVTAALCSWLPGQCMRIYPAGVATV